MFEVLGRKDREHNTKKAMMIHRWSGRIYFIIFFIIMYHCLEYILLSRSELTARSTLHGTAAMLIVVLMGLKLLFMKRYREFYPSIKYLGISMVVLTFVMTGASGGYYMVVSKFGTDKSYDKITQYKQTSGTELSAKIDKASIESGKNLFTAKCIFCHDPVSSNGKVGPGLKGILKRDLLPISGKPATPDNIIKQLRKPINRMPAFDYLSDKEVDDLIAYLNTL
jgi:cytochrome c2